MITKKLRSCFCLALQFVLPLGVPAIATAQTPVETGDGWIWWEAENAVDTDLSERIEWAPHNQAQKDILSEGVWIGADSKDFQPHYAVYDIEVPADGTYQFYLRKMGGHTAFRYRFDDGDWRQIPRTASGLDGVTLRRFIGATWVTAGEETLAAGKHRLRMETTDSKNGFVALDAFLLTKNPVTLMGKRKPGEKLGTAPEGWFAFEPDADPYRDDAQLDLRGLNGDIDQLGRIIRKGDTFVYEKSGQPVRLWSVNAGMRMPRMPRPMIDQLAQYLAKRGINCVRLHGTWAYGSGPQATDINPKMQDDAFYFIAALKKEGIYTSISPYFQHWIDLTQSEAFPDYTKKNGGGRPFTLHFFHQPFQEAMKDWYRAILDQENPYTGTRLADDPAIVTFEHVNEDNFFFWTFVNPAKTLPEPYLKDLETQFGAWLAERYGSLDQALAAWGDGAGQKRDHTASGRMEVYGTWQLTEKGRDQRNDLRARDCAEFLVHTMAAFYQEMIDFTRDELGYDGIFNSTSFAVADPKIQTGLFRLAQLPLDVTDYHGHYKGAVDKGDKQWLAGPGTKYYDRSVLRLMDPEGKIQSSLQSVMHRMLNNDRPVINTEFSYMLPNRFHGELPATVAIFGREVGYDQVSFFALDESTGWISTLNDNFYQIQTPTVAGQWPATALLFRSGVLDEGRVLVHETIDEETLYRLEGTTIVPPMFIDDVGAAAMGTSAAEANAGDNAAEQSAYDPRAFLLGKVQVDYLPEAEHTLRVDEQLAELTAGDERGMRSSSGNYRWDTKLGLLRLEAAGGQGAVGFLGEAGTIELPDMRIESPLPFGSILAVAMDGQPLDESAKILLQVMSEAHSYGYTATPETGQRTIEAMGNAPIVVKNLEGSVGFDIPGAASAKVTMLDPNGYAIDSFTGASNIELRPDVLYYIIER